jgi:hypothetical protein
LQPIAAGCTRIHHKLRRQVIDATTLITVASIIAGFGVAALMFRLQRELTLSDKDDQVPTWITLADVLVILAVFAAFSAVLALLMSSKPSPTSLRAAAVASAAATILLAGYVPAILAHYRFLFWVGTPRGYCTAWEFIFFIATIMAVFIICRQVWTAWSG